MLQELAPGIHAWETKDFKGFRSFAVQHGDDVVLIDPSAPDEEEARAIAALGTVRAILIASPWHEREAAALAKRYGVPVYAHPDAHHAFEQVKAEPLPAVLPAGLEALEAHGGFKGETAYYDPRHGGTVIAGDCWQNNQIKRAPLPIRLLLTYIVKLRDGLHLTPPTRAHDSHALIASFRRHLERPVERLLMSHGRCLTEGAGEQMRARLEQGP